MKLFGVVLFLFFVSCFHQFSFVANAQYTDSLGRSTVLYAAAAYCEQNTILSWNFTATCQPFFNTFKIYETYYAEDTDAYAYTGYDPTKELIIVGFKGTNPEDILDWIDDITGSFFYNYTCTMAGGNSFQGSEGFCDYYRSLKDLGVLNDVITLLEAHPTYKLIITGHSLGGAAAVVHAVDLLYWMSQNENHNPIFLVTYGQPRVGDYSLSNLLRPYFNYATNLFRIVHQQDVVPHIPFCCFTIEETCSADPTCPFQTPTEVWYNDDMTPGSAFKICSTTNGEDMTCSDSTIDDSVSEHLTYFDVDVGDACCLPTLKSLKEINSINLLE